MASRISTLDLFNKVKAFITKAANAAHLDTLIKDALVTADNELRSCDSLYPLAWDMFPYDRIWTKAYADVSGISQANPGVVTAESNDDDVTGHGFVTGDIVMLDGIDGMDELEKRMFVVEYIDSTTFSLKTIGGLTAVDTSSYISYSSGGGAYHFGKVLSTSDILAGASGAWDLRKIVSCTFDGYPSDPIGDAEVRDNPAWADVSSAQRPKRWRYWQNMTDPDIPTVNHYLFWYPASNQRYNVWMNYQREVPDISTWDANTYPFHPPEIHNLLWHGGLAILAGNNERAQRSGMNGLDVGQVEVMSAQHWMRQWEHDKVFARNFSRELHGLKGGRGGFKA